ncbi:MAG: GYD domain-containing protein [Deltaproteobacteria bacterium]|nr:GYD domain-containing protein [Deltaproteobacteria bacterium]MBI2180228.1 GYD domain-containing protein [Deltaproteobacteria bacterium]MBI2228078.1 GYD domain-containing protein [Deltaproteobacteria bacterium]MBI2365240.1 GYD domain-containing protein [Deltaproteobacteria bacterium]MBI2533249.1 GYD domain-containing protein [Deltaproteobacteria bacterium]
MATYIALVNFTDQGIRHIRQTTERAKGLMNAAANLGIKIKDIYWTLGAFDAVFTAEAPDDETMTAFAASMGSLGNIRTQTMRAFSAQEMNQILAKLPAMDVASAK